MGNRLRGAIVGYGFIGTGGHAAAYEERARVRRDVEIVAVADINLARRKLVGVRWPNARVYADLKTLLDAEAASLDFVDICLPPAYHARAAHAAFDHGLHVICEKPLAVSAFEAGGMLAHAREARRVLFPCHNYKHAPVIRAVREVLAQERIGPVQLVTMQTFRPTHARGVPEWQPDWRRERRHSGGGIAMDHGSHTLYLAFEWMRALPVSVSARVQSRAGADTEDDFQCSLMFPTGTASAHLTWNAGTRKVLYTLHGTKGAIRIEDDELEVSVRGAPAGTNLGEMTVERQAIASHWMDASHVTWFDAMFDQFKAAIAADDFVGPDARDAYFCVQAIEAAYRSAAQGCRDIALAVVIPFLPRIKAGYPSHSPTPELPATGLTELLPEAYDGGE